MAEIGKKREIIVVGGGLAGLSCAMKLAEQGYFVHIISVTKVKRSHSVCAQGGINAAMNLKGEDDSTDIHAYDTIKGGDFLADQYPVFEMCAAAPKIIRMMERFGVPFNRTTEGKIDFRRFGGTFYTRTAFCGASTGQQLLYALDEQVRRYEVKGQIKKYENHEFMRLVMDKHGATRGIVLMNLIDLSLETIRADAVVFGVGGPGLIFRQSTNSTFCTGAANGRLYMQGMQYANGEFIQIHPTAIPAPDKLRLISESVRGEGGRVWVYGDSTKQIMAADGKTPITCGKTGEKWYFLEELYPKIGNLAPRDIASREVLKVCEAGLGIDGKNQVYLDITELPKEKQHKLESVLEIYRKFTGEDPHKVPMRIFPAVHYSMGGAWADYPKPEERDGRYRQMTNIPGCFQIGESEYLYHGANRLGANSLLSCIFGGLIAAVDIPRYLDAAKVKPSEDELAAACHDALVIEEDFKKELFARNGGKNVHQLHEELSNMMVLNMTVKRDKDGLEKTIAKIKQIREDYKQITLDDKGSHLNQTYVFANQFRYMIELALVMTVGALAREESRGAHMRIEYPDRLNDWNKHTIATYAPEGPVITYKAVDNCYIDPAPRKYEGRVVPHFKSTPEIGPLPI